MNGRILVLLGARPRLIRLLQNAGFNVLIVQNPDRPDPVARRLANDCLISDFEDPRFWVSVHEWLGARQVYAVYSFTESGLLAAARLAQHLGVRGQKVSTVERTRDKFRMRRRLEECGIPSVRYALCRTVEDVRAFIAYTGGPVVIKSVDGTAKQGVHLLRRDDDAARILAWCQQDACDDEVLVEEYVHGQEVDVEGFTLNGRHHMVGIVGEGVQAPHMLELWHVFPTPLLQEQHRGLMDVHTKCWDAFEYDFGPSCSEYRLSDRGPILIDAHTRPSGDEIPRLIYLATGFDGTKFTCEALAGLVQDVYVAPPEKALCIHMFFPPGGQVIALNNVEAARAIPGVIELSIEAKVGTILPSPTGNVTRAGHVITEGDTAEAALAIARAAAALVDFVVDPHMAASKEAIDREAPADRGDGH